VTAEREGSTRLSGDKGERAHARAAPIPFAAAVAVLALLAVGAYGHDKYSGDWKSGSALRGATVKIEKDGAGWVVYARVYPEDPWGPGLRAVERDGELVTRETAPIRFQAKGENELLMKFVGGTKTVFLTRVP
jgi:hypothetical protein